MKRLIGILVVLSAAIAMVVVPMAQGQSSGRDQRITPRQLTAKTTPSHARRFPYRYTTRGRLFPGNSFRGVCQPKSTSKYCIPGTQCNAAQPYCIPVGPPASSCRGKVAVRFKAGKNTISLRRAKLRGNCTYLSRVTLRNFRRLRPGHGRLRVSVEFLGNAVQKPKAGPVRFVRYGRGHGRRR